MKLTHPLHRKMIREIADSQIAEDLIQRHLELHQPYWRRLLRRFRHDWDSGDDTLGGACCTGTTRFTCRTCGKTKDRSNGMG